MLIPTLKSTPLRGHGGGSSHPRRRKRVRREIPETEATALLRSYGVREDQPLRELADLPPADINRVALALRQRPSPPRDFPGLLVHVLRHGLRQTHAAAAPTLDTPDDPGGAAHFVCMHGNPKAFCQQCYVESKGLEWGDRAPDQPPPENGDSDRPPDTPPDDLDRYARSMSLPSWLMPGEEAP